MGNGASRMTLYHGIGEKNTGSMLSAPGVRLWKSHFPAPPIHPGHFWFPFPMNLELKRKESTKFGLIYFVSYWFIQSNPSVGIRNVLKNQSREIFGAWDSGRWDLRAPDISRAQDQPYTPQPDQDASPSRVIRMWMFDSKFLSTSRCGVLNLGLLYEKVFKESV